MTRKQLQANHPRKVKEFIDFHYARRKLLQLLGLWSSSSVHFSRGSPSSTSSRYQGSLYFVVPWKAKKVDCRLYFAESVLTKVSG